MRGRQVALVRGINVGRAKRVAMAELRTVMEAMGYGGCRTLLNSGNLVFDAATEAPARTAERIERALESRLGVTATVVSLSAAEFLGVVEECPLVEIATDPSRLLVSFWMGAADGERLQPLTLEDWTPEVFALGGRAAYLWCPNGVLKSRLPAAVEAAIGGSVTTRNWRTVLKVGDLLRS